MIDPIFKSLLDHVCDIYHVVGEPKSPGYGLPASKEYTYPEWPDIEGCTCHFHTRDSSTTSLRQQEPQASFDSRVKVSFLQDTDIRLNDKVINRETGLEYRAEVPKSVRGHHKIVYLQRYGKQAVL